MEKDFVNSVYIIGFSSFEIICYGKWYQYVYLAIYLYYIYAYNAALFKLSRYF